MSKQFTAEEVQKHTSTSDCWIILYGKVYDVTSILPQHPGGSAIILRLAGTDATKQYDPVHPPGTLEENLPESACLGTIDVSTLPVADTTTQPPQQESDDPLPVSTLLNLDEIEAAATKRLERKAWAYYYSASDDLVTKRLNNTIYADVLLRPRIFVDVTQCSLSTTLLGHAVRTPVVVSPAAMARLAHPSGEAGIASACAKFGAVQMISNNASMTPEQIVAEAADDQVFGWQLYVQTERAKSEKMLARINALRPKIKFVCLTLDAPVPGKREDDERESTLAANLPVTSAVGNEAGAKERAGSSGGIGKDLFQGTAADLTWQTTLDWLKGHTDLPIVLKGVQTYEDAAIAASHAPRVAAIMLSNHGGRAMDSAQPPLLILLEIRKYCPWVLDRVDVWLDGGIRRGTDVVKALCLGAKAVGIGRAALFGLAAGPGPEGVERVFEILNGEIATAMRLLGVHRIEDLGPQHVNTRVLMQRVYDGPNTVPITNRILAKL